MAASPIGIIAGQGRLPLAAARGIRAAGHPVAAVGLADQYDPRLPDLCDQFRPVGMTRLGKWIGTFQRWGVHEAVMVGRVAKASMYDPLRFVRQLPDWRAARIWFITTRRDKRPDAVMAAVADELAREGINLLDSTQYIPDLLAAPGAMTRTQPTRMCREDIAFALPLIQRLAELDIGQSLAVKDRDVVAVEAMEGTDAMIARAGSLCRVGWTLVKVAGPTQDLRFDAPTIGPRTIENMAAAGGRCIAVEAGRTILLDKPDLLAAADRAGIAIVGMAMDRE